MQAPPPPEMRSVPLDLYHLLTQSQNMQQYDQAEAERKRQLMQMYTQNIGRV